MKKIIFLSIIMLILLAIGLSGCNEESVETTEPKKSSDLISDNEISISLSEISNNAKFYSYNTDGVLVKYFAVKSSDSDIHVAFNACEKCYSKKLGYRQMDDVMICISCPGEEYAINDLGTKNTAGGCWPSYLPIRIDENNVIIEKSDLEQQKWMFS